MNKPDVHLQTPLFLEEINKLRQEFDTVVECGTNDGTGSTTHFANAGYKVFSCEVNKKMYDKAVESTKHLTEVNLAHSFTTKKSHFRELNIVGYKNLLEEKFLPKSGAEDWLPKMINKFGDSALYFLDSHWTMGLHEFSHFLHLHRSGKGNFTILLDDATNLKHRPSIRYLESIYDKPYEVDHKKGERWCLVRLK